MSFPYDRLHIPEPTLEDFVPDKTLNTNDNLASLHTVAAFDTSPHAPNEVVKHYLNTLARLGLNCTAADIESLGLDPRLFTSD